VFQDGPLPFSKVQYLFVWLLREVMAVWVFFEAIVSPRRIKWGKRTYKLSLGGHTQIVDEEKPIKVKL